MNRSRPLTALLASQRLAARRERFHNFRLPPLSEPLAGCSGGWTAQHQFLGTLPEWIPPCLPGQSNWPGNADSLTTRALKHQIRDGDHYTVI